MKRMYYILTVLVLTNFAFAQTVTFKVNMSIAVKKGTFNIASDTVKIAGSFNNWSTSADVLTKGASDTTYSITKTLTVGDTVAFKFVKNSDGWESVPDRKYKVLTGSSTYTAYFNNDSIYSAPKPVALNFRANMEFEKVSGRFNPATDTMTVRGDFNGWGSTTILAPSPTNNNIYVGTFQDTLGVGESVNYKYAFIAGGGTTWENGDNRVYTITQTDYTNGSAVLSRTFNDLTLATITNAPTQITFMVNVDTARSSVTGQPFASITNVIMAGANAPLAWPGAGWPNSDSALVMKNKMYNDGTHGDSVANDKIWTAQITFPQYSPLSIEYKFGANWGLPTNTGANDNESSVGTNHFITLTPRMLSAKVRNIWSQMGNTPLYNIVTDVKEIGSGIPDNYSLDQNYPNPFNPTTNIRFNMPQSGTVTLKVFNLLGQEVATLLNEFRNAGSYEYSFDASKLNSGIYFYSITTNNYSSTKKMMLIK